MRTSNRVNTAGLKALLSSIVTRTARTRRRDQTRLRPCQVYAVRIVPGRGVPGLIRRMSPLGEFAQSAIDPGGTRVAFWGSQPGMSGKHLWITDIAAGVCRRITESPGLHGHPAWWPDGDSLVCFSTAGVSNAVEWDAARQFAPDRSAANLFRIDTQTRQRTQLTEGEFVDERPAVAPNGEEIVFVSNRAGSLNLWVLDVSNGTVRQLTFGSPLDYRPVFAPDGHRIAYFTRAHDGRHQLAMITYPDGDPLGVALDQRFAWVHGPYWSADGLRLLLHGLLDGNKRPSLWVVEVSTGHCRRLIVPGIADCSHGTWDAHERWLAFDSREAMDLEPPTLIEA